MTDSNTYGFSSDGTARIVAAVKAVERGKIATTAADKFRLTPSPNWFWGKIESSSYTNNRYTVTRQTVSNTSSDPTEAVTWADSTGDFALTVTATNAAEAITASHSLPVNTIVRVWWEYDAGSTNTIRYTFSRKPGLLWGKVASLWSPGSTSISLTPCNSAGTPTGASAVNVTVEYGAAPQYCGYVVNDLVAYFADDNGTLQLAKNRLPAMTAMGQGYYDNGASVPNVVTDFLRAI